MDYLSLFGIAVGFIYGRFCRIDYQWRCIEKVNLLTALKIAACFGMFQGAMLSLAGPSEK